MSLADATGRAWAALDGAAVLPGLSARPVLASGSACGPGKTARRRGFSWPPGCLPTSWPACPGVHVKVTGGLAERFLCGGSGQADAAGVLGGWNTDQMPRVREPRIARVRRWCQQRVPGMLGTGPGWNATSARGT